MPDVNIKGRYRIYTHDGTEPLLFTSYSTSLCSIRRPNPNTFITISTYIPGSLSPFTTFDPGSSYTIVSRSNTANFSIGPYVRADRLPSSVTFKSPNFYHGLDKNSITVALSSYALSVNAPLSTAFTYIPDQNGYSVNSISFDTERFNQGLPSLLTHLTPGSSYQFKTRVPFTFFAPLQSEMGDAWATGANDDGQLGMGSRYSDVGYTQLYGNWDKVVMSSTHAAALSTCGTKKKLFVCGGNTYGQLGLTQPFSLTMRPSITATQTVWKELQNIWTWMWDEYEFETFYYRNVLDSEDILDVEVGDDFTLIKTNVQLYGCGRMCNMGIAAPGANSDGFYQYNDARGNSFTSYHIPHFTSFLQRSTPTFFYYTYGADSTRYNALNSVKKFQARGLHWFYLNTDGRLYGQGKIAASSNETSNQPIVMPVGATDQRTASSGTKGYLSTTQLYGPGNPSTRYYYEFYDDFEANLTCIAALSANLKTWLVHGPVNVSYLVKGNPSLSTICFYDPNQNAYVPQNDYFLRVYPSWFGFMAIYNGKLYFTPNGASINPSLDAGGVYGVGTGISSRLPTGVAILNNALGVNPLEKTQLRSLIPLTYMGQPDINWKSLFTTYNYSAAIDSNNKLYVTGYNSNATLGFRFQSLLGVPSSTSNIYTFTKFNEENIFNINSNINNLVVYKTNRNPAPSPTPIPSPTPTPSTTPIPLVPSDVPNAIFVSYYSNFGGSGDRAYWMRSTDGYNTATVTPGWAWLTGTSTPAWLGRSCFDFKDSNNVVVCAFGGKTGTFFNVYKQIVKGSATWNVSSALNDIATAGTTIATWNSTDTSSPYFRGTGTNGTGWPVGKVDMFVHRNSNTAVYVFTQWRNLNDSDSRNGSTGAWTFTVNLANNAVGGTTAITNKNLCLSRWQDNTAYWYIADISPMPKTTRPLKKLPDGTVIFRSMYKNGSGALDNYGALALIGRYNTPTWEGFTDSRDYIIPNSADSPDSVQSTYPAWTEFAKLGNDYYLAWCTKTKTDAQGVGGGFTSGFRTQANLVLRNLQSGTQVQVDTNLNTSTSTPFGNYGNLRLKPYDIIGDPTSRRIYVAYAKYTTFTGNPDSNSNVLGIFVKRYDQNLNLIDTIQLFSYTEGGVGFGPALICPVFSYYVNANGVLKLILAFSSNLAGSISGGGRSGDYIFTNTPSSNNTWTQVFNNTGTTNRIYMGAAAGNDVISV